MLTLNSEERRALRARAHSLNPVVAISQNGLSDPVVREIDASLAAHELIKIRVHNDDRDTRESFLASLCERLAAAPVQHIGKLLVLWRPRPEKPQTPGRARLRRNAPHRSKRSFQGSAGS
ncbi:MAG TPA: YhbY family RNA-binding protein [Candidatus Accumulibacter phosphatis]|nr:MAG: RNA-binding protein [Candidatus Accumulibacter sp. SK-11]HAY28766.1 ribosome assembly RNA-binding protein YhbY [Accumulibacter sp.]HRL74879.1 YhbY family RNA-binding protein [Candidatus Accumulibacter phosphatis]HCN68935.1 ribosome assembly RNA-binding protein YhbY [Accumulibacter sp.]HCV13674.1 ribosome assembly RNA-binding protein YhbY [Accumulibacter sp.]